MALETGKDKNHKTGKFKDRKDFETDYNILQRDRIKWV